MTAVNASDAELLEESRIWATQQAIGYIYHVHATLGAYEDLPRTTYAVILEHLDRLPAPKYWQSLKDADDMQGTMRRYYATKEALERAVRMGALQHDTTVNSRGRLSRCYRPTNWVRPEVKPTIEPMQGYVDQLPRRRRRKAAEGTSQIAQPSTNAIPVSVPNTFDVIVEGEGSDQAAEAIKEWLGEHGDQLSGRNISILVTSLK